MTQPIVLGYWDIRGFAQPIRFLLETAGAEYKEEFYSEEGPPGYSKESWFTVKPTLPLDFPNLPYLYDGDVKITQSISILRYLGRKFGFEGKTEEEKVRIDLIEQQVVDWRNEATTIFYDDKYEDLIGPWKEGLKEKLTSLSKFLGDREYLSGAGISYVDFLTFEWFEINEAAIPLMMEDANENLKNYCQRIRELPAIIKYMSSDKYMSWPFTNPHAKILGRYSEKPCK